MPGRPTCVRSGLGCWYLLRPKNDVRRGLPRPGARAGRCRRVEAGPAARRPVPRWRPTGTGPETPALRSLGRADRGRVALGVAVAAGSTLAANAAALLMAGAAAAILAAIMAGRTGAPCACFGAKGQGRTGQRRAGRPCSPPRWRSPPILPRTEPTTDQWLDDRADRVRWAGLDRLSGVVVVALAREVGMLRLAVSAETARWRSPTRARRSGPRARSSPPFELDAGPDRARRLHLRGLRAVPGPRAHRGSASARTRAWCCARSTRSSTRRSGRPPTCPGSPFAVALDADGTVLAKGTFNSGAQLESVPGHGRSGRRGASAPGVRAEGGRGSPTRSRARARAAASWPGSARRWWARRASSGRLVVAPGEAEAYHFCGHIYTTDSCPHPTGLPRIDAKGLPDPGEGRPAGG